MDKIYTRKRIRLPSVKYVGFKNGKNSRKQKIAFQALIILTIAFMTLNSIVRSVEPIINRVCKDAAMAKATMISNDMATEVMKKYTYNDFVIISKDSKGNITMLQSNIITINEITSDVAAKIQEELIQSEESLGKLRLRKFHRNKIILRYRTRYKYKIFRHRNSRNKSKIRV